MPEGIGPTFGERDFAVGEAGDKRIERIERDYFAAAVLGNAIE